MDVLKCDITKEYYPRNVYGTGWTVSKFSIPIRSIYKNSLTLPLWDQCKIC